MSYMSYMTYVAYMPYMPYQGCSQNGVPEWGAMDLLYKVSVFEHFIDSQDPCVYMHILAYPCVSLRIHAYPCIFSRILAYPCVYMRILAYPCVSLRIRDRRPGGGVTA